MEEKNLPEYCTHEGHLQGDLRLVVLALPPPVSNNHEARGEVVPDPRFTVQRTICCLVSEKERRRKNPTISSSRKLKVKSFSMKISFSPSLSLDSIGEVCFT